MRVVSLLPSATEIVSALGARDQVVARSHECDYPPGIEELPVLTRPRIGVLASSREIHAAANAALSDAMSIYDVDIDALRAVRADVIVTQDLCPACAVPLEDARSAVVRLAREDIRLVNLGSLCLEHIWSDVRRVAEGIGRRGVGVLLAQQLSARMGEIASRARRLARRPSVLVILWLDPIMISGLWMPELVALAGGDPLLVRPGKPGRVVSSQELGRIDPDVVVIAPCGFSIARTLSELPVFRDNVPATWRAFAEGRVYVADGTAYFHRAGPRIVESLEILAACLHPNELQDLATKHAGSFVPVA